MILELENNVHLSPNIDESGRFELKSLTFSHNPESATFGKLFGLLNNCLYFRKGFCVKFRTFQKFQHSVKQSSDHKVKQRFRHGEYNAWALKPEKLVSLLAGLLGPPRINLLRERDFLVIPVQPFIHSFRVERYNAIRQNLHMFLLKIRSSSNVIHE